MRFVRRAAAFFARDVGMKAAVILATLFIAVFGTLRPVVLSGDPYGIFYPIVQAIHGGHGLTSYSTLWRGPMKMPLQPTLLAFFAVFDGDLIHAGQAAGTACALIIFAVFVWALRRAKLHPLAIVAALALVATNVVFARAAVEPLPDIACCAALALTVYFLMSAVDGTEPDLAERTVRRRLFWAGACAGVAVLARINAAALWPAGIVAVAVGPRGRRFGRCAVFTAGFLVAGLIGGLPTIVLLATRKIAVPHFFVRYIDNNIGNISGVDSFSKVCRHGLAQSHLRIGWVMQWLIAAVGLSGLLIAVFREKRRDAMIALAVLLTMMVPLVPIHFEARYYVYTIPILTGAFAVAYSTVADRLRIPKRIALLLLLAASAAVSGFQTNKALHMARRELKADLPYRNLCRTLMEAQSQAGRFVLVGINYQYYRYERLRDCPVPKTEPSPVMIVPGGPDDVGLDFWIERRTIRPQGWKLIGSAEDRDLFVRESPPVTVTSSAAVASRPLLDAPWKLNGPLRPHESCSARSFEVSPGLHRVRAELASDFPLAARLELVAGPNSRVLWGVGRAARVLETTLFVPQGARLEAKLCLGDSLLSSGDVEVTRLEL